MTLDEDLIEELDQVTRRLKTTRSAFARRALRREIEHIHESELERKHISGYKKTPVKNREFDIWEKEQVWTD
jgi:metal-responsive CopG/Arc/MetJ family transcriptional regulator